jgi:hypothetical protein
MRQKSGWCSCVAASAGVFVLLLASGCGGTGQGRPEEYPAPRYPRYMLENRVEGLMTAARVAVRQAYGRCPLGKMQSGQRVYVLFQNGQDETVWEAIRRAWAERGVDAQVLGSWDIFGMTKDEYARHAEANLLFGNEAWQELGVFRPEYQPFFPEDVRRQFKKALTSQVLRKNIMGYLDKHPEIEHMFAGTGGGWVQQLGRHGDKHVGHWIYMKPFDLLTKTTEFPGDVWNMVDDKIVKPISHVTEGSFTDPEGTRLHWTLTREQTAYWSSRTGGDNHLNLYPPPVHATWVEGVVRASANHTGFYPTMTVRLSKHGRVEAIEGGGKTGELFRMLVDHPKMKSAQFPSYPESGYWFLSQDGFATNPKFVRDVELLQKGFVNIANLSERNRAGVQHFSFSYDRSSSGPEDIAYAKAQGLPLEHTSHMHVYFPTVRWKLADTGEWITVADKGYVKAFDDPEVRALAARYGDPAQIFRYEWIPSIPGINVPGDHDRDYGADPWKWITAEWQKIRGGAYEYYLDDYALQRPAKTSE